MGILDFFKKRPTPKKFAYPFTATDSFRLFTEGLRAFQVWQGHTTRINFDTDRGRDKESFLTEALACWRECDVKYPDDMFPAFYLAIACCADGRRDECIARLRKLAAADPDGEIGKCAQFNIVALQHGDTETEAARLGLPQPPQCYNS